MASIIKDDKAAGLQPTVTATEQLYAITPTTTSTTNEKKDVVSSELHRNSSVSAPSSVHNGNPFDTDIEAAALSRSCDNLNQLKTTYTGRTLPNPNCTVWPGQEHWRQKAKAQKRKNRTCNCMAGYSRRTRIILKILIIFLIIGIAVGVGFGVSKPLGAGIWKPKDS
ncbi:uncharacterized protein B0I36DRAFT_362026 [Microdochium trichocladiopsis]|uniref:Uncharacterized protein n=1 Tax=Microdochium trichocladiopsis TaxID=1682393 RepID=A0A9P8YA16_9PEZI|nr:uncharacterized protein B0I36DRAFT_362026 [Microdochium trichocladiopsis]KAH7033346.1 hypothetical protein B0I36DRAFT_362026 [Microdochium trichocladiopsis]